MGGQVCLASPTLAHTISAQQTSHRALRKPINASKKGTVVTERLWIAGVVCAGEGELSVADPLIFDDSISVSP